MSRALVALAALLALGACGGEAEAPAPVAADGAPAEDLATLQARAMANANADVAAAEAAEAGSTAEADAPAE